MTQNIHRYLGLSHLAIHNSHRHPRWAYQSACVDPSAPQPQSTSVAMFGGMVRGSGIVGGGPSHGADVPGNPLFDRHNDIMPQGAMSAVITRDTVTSNAFANGDGGIDGLAAGPGGQIGLEDAGLDGVNGGVPVGAGGPVGSGVQGDLAGVPEVGGNKEVASFAEEPSEVDVPSRVPAGSDRVPKKKKPSAPTPASSEEDDDGGNDSFPFNLGGRKGIPTYNAFFPIHISSGSLTRSRQRSGSSTAGASDEEDAGLGGSGSATAIANSFSTGRGGVATSHATSFGDPYLAAMLAKNGLFNFRSKPGKSEA
ncbi:unnamed protein product [Acanthoscelides obtectus]|uniref:Uncharacterized protein n=1 Tax=Acanthoscelides obtectus TaxID=200917 RepID=A0A9P0K986_ACAOB|nr:unnamed protein product [Acanthoscelides obtectus]CAK1671993.1 hypothetical protein AOBTE_LOCUS28596 [Acanthoscelides obtectus]